MMEIVIKIDEKYYEILKHDVDKGMDYLPCVLIAKGTPLPKGHGRLGDLDKLESEMYHKAFETDTDLQRWDSGCWIRYKMFEIAVATASTIIEADEVSEDEANN